MSDRRGLSKFQILFCLSFCRSEVTGIRQAETYLPFLKFPFLVKFKITYGVVRKLFFCQPFIICFCRCGSSYNLWASLLKITEKQRFKYRAVRDSNQGPKGIRTCHTMFDGAEYASNHQNIYILQSKNL